MAMVCKISMCFWLASSSELLGILKRNVIGNRAINVVPLFVVSPLAVVFVSVVSVRCVEMVDPVVFKLLVSVSSSVFLSSSSILTSSSSSWSGSHNLSSVVIVGVVFFFRKFVIVVVGRHFYVSAHVEFLLGSFSTVTSVKSTYACTSNKNSRKLS